MLVPLLFRSTLLLLLADHCITQEWYTHADLRTDLSTDMLQRGKPSFREKRDVDVNDANAEQSTEYYYVANTRQKRGTEDNSEDNGNTTDDSLSHVPEGNLNSSEWYTLLETNATNAENNTYDTSDWKNGNDRDTEIIRVGGYKGNRTTMLDDVEKSSDIVDDKKGQSSSSQHASRASEVMNAMQENKKKETGIEQEAEKIKETGEQADGSEKLSEEHFLTDNEEDEQPVKRQNLGI
ncbi:unnamed protein product [Porites evermanni]|uniref:Uncharacterized protein n=1 Tax=Porites evermanni TaxID=104178 RepID=A0ABN8RJD4_9CNID|nr:unnamed protein product [Porites evermanni]